MPRKAGPIARRPVPNVQKVVAVASGKGGVGKSTVARKRRDMPGLDCHTKDVIVNLAFSLALLQGPAAGTRLRVGILDLDIFGPSIPTLMGLQQSNEPELTACARLNIPNPFAALKLIIFWVLQQVPSSH